MDLKGAYPADRAAALSGVPWSTVHEWARKDVLVPSISAQRIKLWSYTDLMALRIIYWLRHQKQMSDGSTVPAASMKVVRQAFAALCKLDLSLWTEERGPSVVVDRSGKLVLDPHGYPQTLEGQRIARADLLPLVEPFATEGNIEGPDLYRPRPSLRIIPGKLSGAPHVAHTRVETETLSALSNRGLGTGKIIQLYPFLNQDEVGEAIELEQQLERNLRAA